MNKTKIERKVRKKTDLDLVATILKTKKNEEWLKISHIVPGPARNTISLNLRDINEQSVEGDKIVIPGKVLSEGEIDKKITVSALSYSEKAKEKLKQSKTPFNTILEEFKNNPKANKIKIINKSIKRY